LLEKQINLIQIAKNKADCSVCDFGIKLHTFDDKILILVEKRIDLIQIAKNKADCSVCDIGSYIHSAIDFSFV